MDIARDNSAFPTLLHYYYALTRALHRGGVSERAPSGDPTVRRRRSGLPKELVYMILRYAEILSPRTSNRLSLSWKYIDPATGTDPNANPIPCRRFRTRINDADQENQCEAVVATNSSPTAKLLFTSEPLNRATIEKMGNLALMTMSKDQGRLMNETGSWSWFEVGIVKGDYRPIKGDICVTLEEDVSAKERLTTKLDPRRMPLRWVSHNNTISGHRFSSCMGVEFGPQHPIFRLMEPGDRLGVWMCARHNGWACKAQSASLIVWEWFEPRWL